MAGAHLCDPQPHSPQNLRTDGGQDSHRDHPEQVPPVQRGARQTWYGQRRHLQSGPVPHPSEDQRPDPAGDQAGQQHEKDLAPGETDDLQHENSGDKGVAEDGRDRSSRAGSGDQGHPLGRLTQPGSVSGKYRQAAAQGDQRRLRAEDSAQHQG